MNTVHGHQEGTTVGYNPRYHGRGSYQPLIAFEGNSKAAIHAELRSGSSPSGNEIVDFYKQAKQNLPDGVQLGYVRADRGFSADEFLCQLESDEVDYVIKIRSTSHVKRRQSEGILWNRIYMDDTRAIEVGSVNCRLSTWDKHRRLVFIRKTEYVNHGQLRLFDLWDYQVIVTNLDWSPEEIWHFYNQRATCENYIKELKYGLNIDTISKGTFLANAADLWLKVISYNTILAMKNYFPQEYKTYSISRIQRVLLQIPALVVKHARRLTLRMPSWWPYSHFWQAVKTCFLLCEIDIKLSSWCYDPVKIVATNLILHRNPTGIGI